ncbi:hypothetical protein [Sinorhizobium medicae]|uniref:hypothetical protein n=1 Tax=Sinorhizobium medicae TaxID=110321 RepID=UPI0013E32578|nr:hypothetical protein [Sinorhizobium medicae]
MTMEATWGGVMRRLHRTAQRGESCQESVVATVPRTRRIDDGGNRHRLDPADRAVVAQHDALADILDDDPIQTKCLIAGDGRLWVRLGEKWSCSSLKEGERDGGKDDRAGPADGLLEPDRIVASPRAAAFERQ